MDYQRREWLKAWGGSSVFVSIVDDVPDLEINDGMHTVSLLHYHEMGDTSPVAQVGHEENLRTLRTLIEVLSEFHSQYLAALNPDSVSGNSYGAKELNP